MPLAAARLAVAIALAGVVASCSTIGSHSSQSGAAALSVPNTAVAAPGPTGAPGSTASPAPASEPAGGEAATVRFLHPTAGWWIDAPGRMTPSSDGAARYQGPHDFLQVAPLVGSSDPGSVAAAEAATPTGAGYRVVRGPHAVSLAGVPAMVFEYQADGAANPVTGKPTVVRAVRLYVARQGGVYRVEYGSTGTAADWDPQGAVDNVTTFRRGR